MDREGWQATVHGVARVRHDLATKERERDPKNKSKMSSLKKRAIYYCQLKTAL